MSLPTLVLGGFDLTDWSGSDYGASVIAEGTSRGGPVSIDVAVQSWLQDGSVVVTQGYDNREVSLRVRMRAPDLLALAEAEAALFAELGKPNLLTWTPADGYGPPSVFVVVTSSMVEAPGPEGDIAEVSHFPWRTYNLSLICEAFVRSEDEVVAAALGSGTITTPPTITTVTIDDGSSTANWSGQWFAPARGTSGAAVITAGSGFVSAASSDQVYHAYPRSEMPGYLNMTRTGTIDVSVTKQIVVSWKWGGTWDPSLALEGVDFRLLADGIDLERIGGPKVQWVNSVATTTFLVPAPVTSISALTVAFASDRSRNSQSLISISPTAPTSNRTLSLDSIVRNNANVAGGTARQLTRSIQVAGSARTQGSVSIQHENSALGDVLAYFWPEDGTGYAPPMRRYRTAGGSVDVDTALVSGARENIAGAPGSAAVTFQAPATAVPAGSYLVLARMQSPTAQQISLAWATTTRLAGTDIGPAVAQTSTLNVGTSYGIFALGRVQLPTRDLPAASSSAVVDLAMTALSPTYAVNLDEVWLFNTTVGRLIQVSCGTGSPAVGGPARRVFIDPPTVTMPRPTVRIGHSADRSDSFHPASVQAWQFPEFRPPETNVFTVTTGALDAAVQLVHSPRWHTHAAS